MPAERPSNLAPPAERYMPQLDGLRAIAVVAVMAEHWLPPAAHLNVPWGLAGVHLFFVLSGFLITGILLRARDAAEAVGQRARSTLWRFYARRFVRIFPLYYAAILASVFLLAEGRDALVANLFYVANIDQYFTGRVAGSVGHFWTLAVEEQFYLVWPFVLLLAPRRMLLPIIVAAVAMAPVSRVALICLLPGRPFVERLPFACLDSLGLGALLALLRTRDSSRSLERGCLLVGVPLWIALRGVALFAASRKLRLPQLATLEISAMALTFTWLVGRASAGFEGVVGRVLKWRPALYIGAISYGLYVVHPFVFPVVLAPVRHWPVPQVMGRPPLKFAALFATTVAIASASWWLFERPINGLKRHVRYVRSIRNAAITPADLVPR